MKERPILFSTPMVQAILEGRKTMTRRVVKPHPDDDGLWNHTIRPMSLDSKLEGWQGTVDGTGESKEFKCKYGQPGDVLWVRETWCEYYDPHGHPFEPLFAYKADNNGVPDRWKPSIHMPKAACRLRLLIKSIRVERLQDISPEDIKAEGVYWTIDYYASLLQQWQDLWIKINGPESWEANPWVWVIEFSKIK